MSSYDELSKRVSRLETLFSETYEDAKDHLHTFWFFADEVSGTPVSCICNARRYEFGHLEDCPIFGYKPEVLVIETMSSGGDA